MVTVHYAALPVNRYAPSASEQIADAAGHGHVEVTTAPPLPHDEHDRGESAQLLEAPSRHFP
jgi:hypothetical protein